MQTVNYCKDTKQFIVYLTCDKLDCGIKHFSASAENFIKAEESFYKNGWTKKTNKNNAETDYFCLHHSL